MVRSEQPGRRDAFGRSQLQHLTLAPVDDAVGIIKAYYDAATPAQPSQRAGIVRFIIVAETDSKAQQLADAAYGGWYENFNSLYRRYGRGPVLGEQPKTFEAVVEAGKGIAGSPATVLKELQRQVTLTQANYLVGQFAFGAAPHADIVHSIELFAKHVMPELNQRPRRPLRRPHLSKADNELVTRCAAMPRWAR